MSFPAYDEYKDSRVDWLGEVPSDWRKSRIKHLCYVNDGNHGEEYPTESDYTSESNGVPFIRGGNLDNLTVSPDNMLYITPEKNASMRKGNLRVNDILFVNRGDIGKIALISEAFDGANLNSQIAYLRVGDAIGCRYLMYFLCSTGIGSLIESMKAGSVLTQFPIRDINNLEVPIPSADEQRAISSFLDVETSKIDGLVSEQRRLIELLKEKRQAVISHAVTKGLNPNAPMKPSGIQWLGDVPQHWAVGAVKHFVASVPGAIKTGPFGSHLKSSEMESGTIKVYNQRSVIDNDFVSGDNFVSEKKFGELASFETFPGDVLVTTRGTIGRAAILPEGAEQGILHPCLLRIQVDEARLDRRFIKTLIHDSDLMKTQLGYLSNATTIEVIYSNTMASVIIPVPPLDEQGKILQFLADAIGRFDTLLAEAERAIELLQERRTALISAAVTGKIDVREFTSCERQGASRRPVRATKQNEAK